MLDHGTIIRTIIVPWLDRNGHAEAILMDPSKVFDTINKQMNKYHL